MGRAEIGVFGDWVVAVGTVIAALGTTPSVINEGFYSIAEDYPEHHQKLTDYLKVKLGFWGNLLQASGNIIGAQAAEPGSLDQFGDQVGATGNVTVIASLKEEISFEEEQALFILGNALQAIGSLIGASIEFEATGNLAFLQGVSAVLEAIGNVLQILGALLFFDEDIPSGRILIYYGSWIQAIGANFLFLFGAIELDVNEEESLEKRAQKQALLNQN